MDAFANGFKHWKAQIILKYPRHGLNFSVIAPTQYPQTTLQPMSIISRLLRINRPTRRATLKGKIKN